MPTNDFLPFAIDVNAGVMSQADYPERAGLGVAPGIADPDFANKAWRQGANMAAALGILIADQGYNALDNGDIAALKNALKASLLPEKGIWTPTVYGSSTPGAVSITTNNCFYRRIGDLVFLRVRFEYKVTSSPTGHVYIGGVPYIPDFYYTDWMTSNANTGIALSITNSGLIRPAYLNTTSGMLTVCDWGASATASTWKNTVNATDMLLGTLLYRTSA